MSVLTLKVDEVMRTLSAESSNPFVVHDKEVDIVRFAINSGFADIVLDGQVALRVMYQRPGETEVRAQTLTYYDTDGLRNYYDWQLLSADLEHKGTITCALCILDISGGEVSEWHTTPCEVRVLSTIHTDDSDEGDDTITPTVRERVAVLETMIQRVASGAPIVVASTSAMTDTEQIYVLSTNGNWYYHNGTTWVSGGEYGAVSTDTTLTQSGIPADAKAVGDKLTNLKSELSIDSLAEITVDKGVLISGEYVNENGEFVSDASWIRTDYIDCSSWKTVKSASRMKYNTIYNAEHVALGQLILTENVEIAIPDGAAFVVFSGTRTYFPNAQITAKVEGPVCKIQKEINNLEESLKTGTLNIQPFIPDTYIGTNGNQSGYVGWSSTNFIPIDDGAKYLIVSATAKSEYNCFYDGSKEKLKMFTVPVGETYLPVPDDAKYFRLSNVTSGLNGTAVKSYFVTNILEETKENIINISSGFVGDVISLNPGIKSEILQVNDNKYMTVLHLSDIHINVGSLGNLQDVVAFYEKYKENIDATICTGDMVGQKFSDTYYTKVWDANGGGKLLTCIGNHDCTEGGNYYAKVEHTQTEVYKKFIEPYVTGDNPSWGAVNYQENITYWYKVYEDKKTIIISMNALLTGDEADVQNIWLQNVLATALNGNYSVIILTHYGPYNGVKIECNFTDKSQPVLSGFNTMYQESVQSFIDDGGEFVCYLSGHTHYDLICKNSNFPNQLFVVVTSVHGPFPINTKPYNRFNVLSFNKTDHTIKIVRVGADRDKYMRHIGTICLNYRTLEVLSSD